MSIYSSRKRRAKKKKLGTRTKKLPKKKRSASKRPKQTAPELKRPKVKAKRPKVRAKRPKQAARPKAKRPKVKSKRPKRILPTKRPKVRLKVRPKDRTPKVRPKTKKVRAKLSKIRALEQKARGQKPRSQAKVEVKRLKKTLAKDLVSASKKTKVESSESHWQRLRRRFRELLDLAESTNQTPSSKRRSNKIDSKQNVGEQRFIRIKRVLTINSVEDIIYKVQNHISAMKKIYSIWYADLGFSGLGERMFGSGNQILVSDDPDAVSFQAQGYDNTGLWASIDGLIQALRNLLEDYADSKRTIIYLHYIRVLNFDRKRRWM